MNMKKFLLASTLFAMLACGSEGTLSLDLGIDGETTAQALSAEQWDQVCATIQDKVDAAADEGQKCSIWAGSSTKEKSQCDALVQSCNDNLDLATPAVPYAFCSAKNRVEAAAGCNAEVALLQQCGLAMLQQLDDAVATGCPGESTAALPPECESIVDLCPGFDHRVLAFRSKLKSPETMVVLGMHPARAVTGEDATLKWQGACRGELEGEDGFLLNFAVEDPGAEFPGVLAGDWTLSNGLAKLSEANVTAQQFQVAVDCLKDSAIDGGGCASTQATDTTSQNMSFLGASEGPHEVAIAILIDNSGSTTGLVDPFAPYLYKEDKSANIAMKLPQNTDLAAQASDPTGKRIDAAWEFINMLDGSDRYVVVAYSEDAVKVVCDLATAESSVEESLAACLTNVNSYPMGSGANAGSALQSLKGSGGGRTPLWQALSLTYDLMQTHSASTTAGNRHIVVLSDGPDTCSASGELNECLSVCLEHNTSYDSFRAQVLAENETARVPIHFVQIPAPGYTVPDPLQQEMACLTRGHYWFEPVEKVAATLYKLRLALRGHWQLAVSAPELMTGAGASHGYVYDLDGKLAAAGDESSALFSASVEAPLQGAPVRIHCSPAKDSCTAGDSGTPCAQSTSWCSSQTHTCVAAQQWVLDGTSTQCDDANALIRVEIKPEQGNVTWVEKELSDLPTLCCDGTCTPPAPPSVPADVRFPPSGICFVLKDESWVPETSPEGTILWVIEAQLRESADCSWEIVSPYLELDPDPAKFQDQWDCSGKGNCYPPPA